MIFDSIQNANRYLGITPNLDKALKYMMETDWTSLSLGRHDVDQDNVFVNVMEADTNPDRDREYEFHKIYYDIQLDIIGSEEVLFGTAYDEITKPYQTDIGFGRCRCKASCRLTPGTFVICSPEEPHLPGTAPQGTSETIKKAVIKVKRD